MNNQILNMHCIVTLILCPYTQLGRLNDAAMLLRECGRHDLLNELYQVVPFVCRKRTHSLYRINVKLEVMNVYIIIIGCPVYLIVDTMVPFNRR